MRPNYRLAGLAFSFLIGSFLSLIVAGINLLSATLFISGIICECAAEIISAIERRDPAGKEG